MTGEYCLLCCIALCWHQMRNHPSDFDPILIRAYSTAFIPRTDCYPLQLEKGTYAIVKKPFSTGGGVARRNRRRAGRSRARQPALERRAKGSAVRAPRSGQCRSSLLRRSGNFRQAPSISTELVAFNTLLPDERECSLPTA